MSDFANRKSPPLSPQGQKFLMLTSSFADDVHRDFHRLRPKSCPATLSRSATELHNPSATTMPAPQSQSLYVSSKPSSALPNHLQNSLSRLSPRNTTSTKQSAFSSLRPWTPSRKARPRVAWAATATSWTRSLRSKRSSAGVFPSAGARVSPL